MTMLINRIDPAAAVLSAGDFVMVRAEAPHEADERDALLARAMAPDWRAKAAEKLRRGRLPADNLAFVAKDQSGSVLGTVRLWDVEAGIDRMGRAVPALLLGPLAVDPAAKGAGIGSALMLRAVEKARGFGHGAILLVGDAPYYGRFGFSARPTGALVMPGPVERGRFLALELQEGYLAEAAGFVMPSGRRL